MVEGGGAGYEFSAAQEGVIRSLSRYLRVFGALLGVGGLFALWMGFEGPWHFFVQGVLLLLIGGMSAQAGVAFGRITTTRGDDIGLLLEALGTLRGIYAVQVWLIGCVVAVLGLVAVLVWLDPA